jgi:hypothetical protein
VTGGSLLNDIVEHGGEDRPPSARSHLREPLHADEGDFQAVLLSLLIIGEAAETLPDEVCAAPPAVNWAGAAGMRDIIARRYFGVDSEIIWDAAKVHVPRRPTVAVPSQLPGTISSVSTRK